ncbi:hypothetical protein RA27_19045 [Ruegeria sp. ANG-R]|nr:hypothetical protein RA27_19045 [Ruegeria sp. ANG-R]
MWRAAFEADGPGGASVGAGPATSATVGVERGFGAASRLQSEADRAVVADVLTDPAANTVHGQARGCNRCPPGPIFDLFRVQRTSRANAGAIAAEGAGTFVQLYNRPTLSVEFDDIFGASFAAFVALRTQIKKCRFIRSGWADGCPIITQHFSLKECTAAG